MRGQRWMSWFMVGMGVLFLSAGLAGTYAVALRPMMRAQAATSWTQTTCHVLRAGVVDTRRGSGGGSLFEAEVDYEYQVSGRRYTGSRIAFTRPVSKDAFEIVDRYPAGAETPCWYDPADPASVTLSREVAGTFVFVFALLLLIGGFFVFRYGTRLARQRRPGSPTSDGGVRYERRGSGIPEVVAIASISGVIGVTAVYAVAQDIAYVGPAAVAIAGLAVAWLAHELRCALSVVTVVVPAEIDRDTDVRIEPAVRTPFGAPPITASAQLVETWRSFGKSRSRTIKTIVVADGVLRIDGPPTLAERDHSLDWHLEVRTHLPYGPDLYVQAPIHVR